eukprot:TRINITY_DN16300_c0_g1_i1.p1 TRINITY_DN16300_c0_g1~~TRINITY_DN16300_c0_g1_i1.p1  ORF type:complete len:291 (+),score=66.43 TRINITY_DN16300_c0_g1_i1:78-875(+)
MPGPPGRCHALPTLGLLLVGIAAGDQQAPAAAEDYWILRLHRRCTPDWQLYGLWPSWDCWGQSGRQPPACGPRELTPRLPLLEASWAECSRQEHAPGVLDDVEQRFWCHEFRKHGAAEGSPYARDAGAYFDTSLRLMAEHVGSCNEEEAPPPHVRIRGDTCEVFLSRDEMLPISAQEGEMPPQCRPGSQRQQAVIKADRAYQQRRRGQRFDGREPPWEAGARILIALAAGVVFAGFAVHLYRTGGTFSLARPKRRRSYRGLATSE